MSQAGIINNSGGGGSGPVTQLTPNIGSPVTATAGNINVFGYPSGATNVVDTYNNAGNFEIEDRSWLTKYVVSPSTTPGFQGTYSTISSAITQAVADGATLFSSPTIFIRTGAYTENITIPAGAVLNIQAFTTAGNPGQIIPDVEVAGNVTFGSGCIVVFKNLFITSSSGDTVTIGNGADVNFVDCEIGNSGGANGVTISGAPGETSFQNTNILSPLLINSSNSSSLIIFSNCQLIQTTVENSSKVELNNCTINSSFLVQGAANCSFFDCGYYTTATELIQNNGSGTVTIVDSDLNTGGNTILSGTGKFLTSGNIISGSSGSLYSNSIRSQIGQIMNQSGNMIKSRTISSSTTIANTDFYVGISGNSGAVAIALPVDNTLSVDQYFIFKDEAGTAATKNITITPASGTIDGAATFIINSNYGAVAIRFDGTNFFTMNLFGILAPPPQTGTVEYFNGIAQVSTASNRYRFYDDMNSINIYDEHTSGSGAMFSSASAIDSGHAGIFEMQTGSTSGGKVSFSAGPDNAAPIILGGGNMYFETCINIQALGVMAGDDYNLLVGVHDGWIFTGPPPSNGFWFGYLVDTSVNWTINSANSGTATNVTTSSVVATGWTRLGIYYNLSTTTATFYINGTSVGTVSTHISTNPIAPTWTVFKTAGTNSSIFYVDYVDIMIDFTSGR